MAKANTVYIVDDDELARNFVCQLVNSMGCASQVFGSAGDFLHAYNGGPGCVVADVCMPVMTGLELQEYLIAHGQSIPVILLSGHADTASVVQAMRRGAVSFLEKSSRQLELWEAINDALKEDDRRRKVARELRAIRAQLATLSVDERDVLQRMINGVPNKSIARDLDVSIRTVEARRRRVFQKMGAHSLAQLLRCVVRLEESERLLAAR